MLRDHSPNLDPIELRYQPLLAVPHDEDDKYSDGSQTHRTYLDESMRDMSTSQNYHVDELESMSQDSN